MRDGLDEDPARERRVQLVGARSRRARPAARRARLPTAPPSPAAGATTTCASSSSSCQRCQVRQAEKRVHADDQAQRRVRHARARNSAERQHRVRRALPDAPRDRRRRSRAGRPSRHARVRAAPALDARRSRCGGSPAGTKRTSAQPQRLQHLVRRAQVPEWIGSNVPPKTPIGARWTRAGHAAASGTPAMRATRPVILDPGRRRAGCPWRRGRRARRRRSAHRCRPGRSRWTAARSGPCRLPQTCSARKMPSRLRSSGPCCSTRDSARRSLSSAQRISGGSRPSPRRPSRMRSARGALPRNAALASSNTS